MPKGIKIVAQKIEGKPLAYNKKQLLEHVNNLQPGCYTIEVKLAKTIF